MGSLSTAGYPRGVIVSGRYAYISDGGSGVQVVEVSKPSKPQWIGGFNTGGSANAVTVLDNLAYVADREGGLVILNVEIVGGGRVRQR